MSSFSDEELFTDIARDTTSCARDERRQGIDDSDTELCGFSASPNPCPSLLTDDELTYVDPASPATSDDELLFKFASSSPRPSPPPTQTDLSALHALYIEPKHVANQNVLPKSRRFEAPSPPATPKPWRHQLHQDMAPDLMIEPLPSPQAPLPSTQSSSDDERFPVDPDPVEYTEEEQETRDALATGSIDNFRLPPDLNPDDRPRAIIKALQNMLMSVLVQLDLRMSQLTKAYNDAVVEEPEIQSRGRKRKRSRRLVTLIEPPQLQPIRIQLADRTKTIVQGSPLPVRNISFPSWHSKAGAGHQLACLMRVVELVKEGLLSQSIQTKRDLYYKDVGLFRKQATVDQLIDDLAATMGCSRYDLNVIAASKGVFYGHAVIRASRDEPINGMSGTMLIPPRETIMEADLNRIDYVLVVEKEAVFQTLQADLEASLPGYRPLLICGKGYPDSNSRGLLSLVCSELPEKIPILGLSDGDPYGIEIMATYALGSRKMHHEDQALVPSRPIHWLGVKTTDYYLNASHTLPMSAKDCQKAIQLAQRVDLPEEWRQELQRMVHSGVKAEIEIYADAEGVAAVVAGKIRRMLET